MDSLLLATLFPFPFAIRAASTVEAIAETLLRPLSREEITHLIVVTIAAQVLTIVAYWIASNVLAKERAKFGDAVQVWGAYVASALAAGAVIFGTFYLRIAKESVVVVAIGVGVVLLVVLFAAPMKAFNFSFPRALGFLLISTILISAGQTLALQLLPAALPFAERSQALAQIPMLSGKDRQRLAERLVPGTGGPATFAQYDAVVTDRHRSIPERHAALQEMYRDLAARRLRLQENDSAGLAAYQRDQTRYELLLLHLQTDAAAAPR